MRLRTSRNVTKHVCTRKPSAWKVRRLLLFFVCVCVCLHVLLFGILFIERHKICAPSACIIGRRAPSQPRVAAVIVAAAAEVVCYHTLFIVVRRTRSRARMCVCNTILEQSDCAPLCVVAAVSTPCCSAHSVVAVVVGCIYCWWWWWLARTVVVAVRHCGAHTGDSAALRPHRQSVCVCIRSGTDRFYTIAAIPHTHQRPRNNPTACVYRAVSNRSACAFRTCPAASVRTSCVRCRVCVCVWWPPRHYIDLFGS